MSLGTKGIYIVMIAAVLACDAAKGNLETTAGVTIDGRVVTDLEMTLGEEPWVYQVAVWAEMIPRSNGTELSFKRTDGSQGWYTSFKLCPTMEGTAIANDILSITWVDTAISNEFTQFYQASLSGTQEEKFTAAYTDSNSGNNWVGEISILNQRTSGATTSTDLRGDYYDDKGVLHQNIYQIGTIEISYDPAKLDQIQESDFGTYILILNDDTASEVYATRFFWGTDLWRASGSGSMDTPKMTLTIKAPVVPEPSTWAMICGVTVFGGVLLRRRIRRYGLHSHK